MDQDKLGELLRRYQAGECTPEERLALEKWYDQYDAEEQELPGDGMNDQQKLDVYAGIVDRLREEGAWNQPGRVTVMRKSWLKWSAAAAILVLTASVLYWNSRLRTNEEEKLEAHSVISRFTNDISPGGNKARLILADGSAIMLDSGRSGEITSQGAVRIRQDRPGLLTYEQNQETNGHLFNTLVTPQGGKYEIVLPDGSRAWLNAASSLRYPTSFTGAVRSVELHGEAYFEIAKNPNQPFKVHVNDIEVEVLGTHFNVMAYNDEPDVKTTLLEGSVKVSKDVHSALLKVGQQASVHDGQQSIEVRDADVEESIAWKNDLFWFHNADIKTVMRQVARWYDVDILYEGTVSKKFNGSIPRNLTAVKVFQILEATGGVQFKINGRTISVLPSSKTSS